MLTHVAMQNEDFLGALMIVTNIVVPISGLAFGIFEFGFGDGSDTPSPTCSESEFGSSVTSHSAAPPDSAIFGNPIHAGSEDGGQALNDGDDSGDQATSEADM